MEIIDESGEINLRKTNGWKRQRTFVVSSNGVMAMFKAGARTIQTYSLT
jgi:hypothetical protein